MKTFISLLMFTGLLIAQITPPASNVTVTVSGTVSVQGPSSEGGAISNPIIMGMIGSGTVVRSVVSANVLTDAISGQNFGGVGPMLYNGTTYDRMRGGVGTDAAGAITNTGIPKVQMFITNSTTAGSLLPIPSAGANGDGSSAQVPTSPWNYAGTTGVFNRMRGAYLAVMTASTTLTGRNSIGTQLVENGSRWTVVSTPAASSVASASIALEASVRHIVDTVCFSATSNGAVTAANGTVDIRDGATGAGTIITQFRVAVLVAAAAGVQIVPPFCVSNLGLVGTTGTAMTAEFSAGVTNATESITLTGYNVN